MTRPLVLAGAVTVLATATAAGVALPWALGVAWAAGNLMMAITTSRRPTPRRRNVPAAEPRPPRARRGPDAAPRTGVAGCGVLYTSVAASPRHGHRAGGATGVSRRPGNVHVRYRTGRARVGA